jgi:hypothetical protein
MFLLLGLPEVSWKGIRESLPWTKVNRSVDVQSGAVSVTSGRVAS